MPRARKTTKRTTATNLPIRLKPDEHKIISKAAKEAGEPVSTWMRDVSLAAAGDGRKLKELLKAVCVYMEEEESE